MENNDGILSMEIAEADKKRNALYILLSLIFIMLIFDFDEPVDETWVDERWVGLPEKERIKKTVFGAFPGTTNLDRKIITKIEITGPDDALNVFVNFNADDNLTKRMRVSSMKTRTSEIYHKLFINFSSIEHVEVVEVTAFFPMTGKYGHTKNEPVYVTYLSQETARKINWTQDDTTLHMQTLPGLWVTTSIHPDFK